MRIDRLGWAAAGLAVLLATAACDRGAPAGPPPIAAEAPDDAAGHYCGMLLSTHEGPKGQIHLASREDPLWFSSVRDTIAFLRLPEEPKDVTAVYVNDMGRATNWASPEPGTWVDANAAWFVVESGLQGGMGAPEAVPFSSEQAAGEFRDTHGGRILRLEDIPDAYVTGPVDLAPPMSGHDHGEHGPGDHAPAQHAPGDHAPADHAPASEDGQPEHHDH